MKSSKNKFHVRKFRGRPLVLTTPVSVPSDTFGSSTHSRDDWQWASWEPSLVPCTFDPEALPRFSEDYFLRNAKIIDAVDKFNAKQTIDMSAEFRKGFNGSNSAVMGNTFCTIPSRSVSSFVAYKTPHIVKSSKRAIKNALQKRNFNFDLSGNRSSSQVVQTPTWVRPGKKYSSLRICLEDFYTPRPDKSEDDYLFPSTVLPCKLNLTNSLTMNSSTIPSTGNEVTVVSNSASVQKPEATRLLARLVKDDSPVLVNSVNDPVWESFSESQVEESPLLESAIEVIHECEEPDCVATVSVPTILNDEVSVKSSGYFFDATFDCYDVISITSERVDDITTGSDLVSNETSEALEPTPIPSHEDALEFVDVMTFTSERVDRVATGSDIAPDLTYDARKPRRFAAAAATVEIPDDVIVVNGNDSAAGETSDFTEVAKKQKVVKPRVKRTRKERTAILAARQAAKNNDPLLLEKKTKGVVLGTSFDSKKVSTASYSQCAAVNAKSDGATVITEVEVETQSESERKPLPVFSKDLEASLPRSVCSKLMKETKYPPKPLDTTDRKLMGRYFTAVNALRATYQRLVCEWAATHIVKKPRQKVEKPIEYVKTKWEGIDKVSVKGHYSWISPTGAKPVRSFYPDAVCDGDSEKFFSGYLWTEYVPSFQWALSDNSPYKGKPSVESIGDIFKVSRLSGAQNASE